MKRRTSILLLSLILLLEKNLIQYVFQPIVDARTGQIYAYEALMRSGGGIQLTSLQILGAAREYNRLYDIERATLFGIIDQYIHNYRQFSGCKVFINTIPGHFLTDDDCSEIMNRYGSYLDCCAAVRSPAVYAERDTVELHRRDVRVCKRILHYGLVGDCRPR